MNTPVTAVAAGYKYQSHDQTVKFLTFPLAW